MVHWWVLAHYDHKVGVSYEEEWYYNVLEVVTNGHNWYLWFLLWWDLKIQYELDQS